MQKTLITSLLTLTLMSSFFLGAMEQQAQVDATQEKARVKSLKKLCIKSIIKNPELLGKADLLVPDLSEKFKYKAIRENLLYFVDIFKDVSRKELIEPDTHHVMTSPAFSTDSTYLLVNFLWGRAPILWDLRQAPFTYRSLDPEKELRYESLSVSDDAQYAAAANFDDNSIYLWDLTTDNANRTTLMGANENPAKIVFSPDCRSVFTSGDALRKWDLTQNPITHSVLHEGRATAMAFSRNGKYMISGLNNRLLRVWDMSNDPVTYKDFNGDGAFAYEEDGFDYSDAIAISSDGNRAITCSRDIVYVWDLSTPSPKITQLRGHKSYILTASFSPCDRFVLTGSHDDTTRLWDLKKEPVSSIILIRDMGKTGDWSNFSNDGKNVVTMANGIYSHNLLEHVHPLSCLQLSLHLLARLNATAESAKGARGTKRKELAQDALKFIADASGKLGKAIVMYELLFDQSIQKITETDVYQKLGFDTTPKDIELAAKFGKELKEVRKDMLKFIHPDKMMAISLENESNEQKQIRIDKANNLTNIINSWS